MGRLVSNHQCFAEYHYDNGTDLEGDVMSIDIELGMSVFLSKTNRTIDAMLKDMEALRSPLAKFGMYGVESMKQHHLLDEYIEKLKKIKKIIHQ